jgi:rubrerythrin
MGALEIVLEKQCKSYDFYEHASVIVQDPDSKAILYELSLKERQHDNILLRHVVEIGG